MFVRCIVLLLLFSQIAAAFDYTDLPELNLTVETPPYDVVWNYNLEQSDSMDDPPDGVDEIDDVPFEDAWIKILAVDKIVRDTETDSILVSNTGNVLVKYDYEPTCPESDYDWGDCDGRRYRLVDWDERLRIYVNDDYEGNDEVEDYSVTASDGRMEFRAELYLEAECKKYQLEEYEEDGEWYCEEEYLGRRYYDDTIEDSVTYDILGLDPEANLSFKTLAENPLEVSRGSLTVKTDAPYSLLYFKIGNMSFSYSRNAFDVESYLPDYDLLRVSTYSFPHVIQSDIFGSVSESRDNTTGEITTVLNFTLSYDQTKDMLDSRNCKVIFTDLFQNTYEINGLCNASWKHTRINASVDDVVYVDGDEIILRVVLTHDGSPLQYKEIVAYYGETEYSGNTSHDGEVAFNVTAEYPFNRIDVEFLGEGEYLSSSKIVLIAVSNSRLKALLIRILPGLLVLVVSAYGVYRMLRFAGVVG